MENTENIDEITEDDFSQLAEALEEGNQEREPDALDLLQEDIRDLLGDSSTFGAPMTVTMPGGQDIVYRQRQPLDKIDVGFDARRSVAKRSSVQKAVHDAGSGKGQKSKLIASRKNSNNLLEQFPLAHELVEYVSGGGDMSNVSRMMANQPPEIHSIEDIADSIDWHLLNKGINSEHIETALSKDRKKVVLFMDDRAQPRLSAIKEVLSKFGEPKVLQRADQVAEATGQPHGFYVFELAPDNAIFTPKVNPETQSGANWDNSDKQKSIADSLEDEFDDVLLEDIFEPFCSTCGDKLFEGVRSWVKGQARDVKFGWEVAKSGNDMTKLAKQLPKTAGERRKRVISATRGSRNFGLKIVGKGAAKLGAAAVGTAAAGYGAYRGAKALHKKFKKNKSSESFDARVGDPKGTKRKDHKSTLGDSIECASCSTLATEINEHSFNGIFCARHGDRLDKFSRACYSCKDDTKHESVDNVCVACPECSTQVTMEALGCGVCGTEFTEDVVNDYSAHIADSLFPEASDDGLLENENDWSDPFSSQLADSLFSDEEDTDSFI